KATAVLWRSGAGRPFLDLPELKDGSAWSSIWREPHCSQVNFWNVRPPLAMASFAFATITSSGWSGIAGPQAPELLCVSQHSCALQLHLLILATRQLCAQLQQV